MKLISLNIWGGKAYEPLMKFIKEAVPTTDIFCLQEVFSSPETESVKGGIRINILSDLSQALPEFSSYFAPEGDNFVLGGPVDFEISGGQATFIKKKTVPKVDSAGTIFTFGKRKKMQKHETFADLGSNFQYLRFESNSREYTICNFHGISEPGDKLDTPARLEQSRKIRQFIENEKRIKIFCGDFNLLPQTESIKIIEGAGMVNLIEKFKVERTRSRISRWWGRKDFQKFADYTFVSPDVNIMNFTVPDVEISDHLPMVLEFS